MTPASFFLFSNCLCLEVMVLDLPKRRQNRLSGYDYSSPNAHFVTACVNRRKNILWEDVGASIARPQDVKLSRCGKAVEEAILAIPRRYPAVSVVNYAIMPNHIHLLLQIISADNGRAMLAPMVSEIVRQLKGFVSKRVGFPLWQKGFYDHVIRDENDFLKIWEYIEGNPMKWAEDELNST